MQDNNATTKQLVAIVIMFVGFGLAVLHGHVLNTNRIRCACKRCRRPSFDGVK